MSDLQIKAYQPNVRAQAARITNEEWQKHDPRIIELHAEGYTSLQARRILREETRNGTACFNPSAFQYTARLKLLGLTRYDIKGRQAPPESSGACSNNSLECCTAEDGSVHSHSRCTSDNEACFCGIQKVEDVQSVFGAPDAEPKELYGPVNDGRGMPEPSPYATLGISSELVSSNSHLDHGLASAVITQIDSDYQIGIRRGGVRKGHALSTQLVGQQDTSMSIQVQREFEKVPHSIAGDGDKDPVALHQDGSYTTFDAALQELNAIEYSNQSHYRLGAPFESIPEDDDVAPPSLQGDDSTADVDTLLHESGTTEHNDDLGQWSTQLGRVDHMDVDHDSTQAEYSPMLSEMGVEVPRDFEGAHTINSPLTSSLTTSNSTINSLEKSPDVNVMAKFVASTSIPEKTTTIPVLIYFNCYVPDMDYSISTDMLQLWPSLWAEPRNISPSCIKEMGVVADCLCAAELYIDAFDLYYVILAYEHKSSFIFDDMRMHAAVLNCARTSATISQDNCAIALLRFALRWHVDYADPKPLSDHDESTKQRFLLARVMHLYLDDLYVKKGRKESEWRTTRPTCVFCSNKRCNDDADLETIDARLPNRHRSILTAETLQRKLADSWGIGYNTSPIPASKCPATVIQDSGVLTKLLVWCSVIIRTKAESLEKFTRILPQSVAEAKELIGQLLFCHFLDRWLKERNGYRGRSRAFRRLESSLTAVQMSPVESLSAAAFMIVGRDHWNTVTSHGSTLAFGKGGLARKLLSNLHSMMRTVSKSRAGKRFAAVYLRLYQTVGEDRNNSPSELSQRAMKIFARNIVSTGKLSQHDFVLKEEGLLFEQDRRWLDEEELVPAAVDFPEYTSRPQPLVDMLFTPRSSFSSGARSFRIYHAEISGRSICSLSTRSSKTPSSGMSMHSHSSLSFSAVTGLPSASPVLMDTEDRELEDEKIYEDLEDEIMLDI